MANERDEPYGGFNFVVELGDGVNPGEPAAGFQEVSGLALAVDVIEYRNGNDLHVRKLPGLARYENVVMRRGFTGSTRLYEWIDSVRSGLSSPSRTVRITLLDEASVPVTRWTLQRAWPIRYVGPAMKADANEVAIEELVLTHERLEMD